MSAHVAYQRVLGKQRRLDAVLPGRPSSPSTDEAQASWEGLSGTCSRTPGDADRLDRGLLLTLCGSGSNEVRVEGLQLRPRRARGPTPNTVTALAASSMAAPPDGTAEYIRPSGFQKGSKFKPQFSKNFVEPYRIPGRYLQGLREGADLGPLDTPVAPKTPIIVFVNAKSGGRAGEQLAQLFESVLGEGQVFLLGTHNPKEILKKLYTNLGAYPPRGKGTNSRPPSAHPPRHIQKHSANVAVPAAARGASGGAATSSQQGIGPTALQPTANGAPPDSHEIQQNGPGGGGIIGGQPLQSGASPTLQGPIAGPAAQNGYPHDQPAGLQSNQVAAAQREPWGWKENPLAVNQQAMDSAHTTPLGTPKWVSEPTPIGPQSTGPHPGPIYAEGLQHPAEVTHLQDHHSPGMIEPGGGADVAAMLARSRAISSGSQPTSLSGPHQQQQQQQQSVDASHSQVGTHSTGLAPLLTPRDGPAASLPPGSPLSDAGGWTYGNSEPGIRTPETVLDPPETQDADVPTEEHFDVAAMLAQSRALATHNPQQAQHEGGPTSQLHQDGHHQFPHQNPQQQLQPIYSGESAYDQQTAQDLQSGYPTLQQQQQHDLGWTPGYNIDSHLSIYTDHGEEDGHFHRPQHEPYHSDLHEVQRNHGVMHQQQLPQQLAVDEDGWTQGQYHHDGSPQQLQGQLPPEGWLSGEPTAYPLNSGGGHLGSHASEEAQYRGDTGSHTSQGGYQHHPQHQYQHAPSQGGYQAYPHEPQQGPFGHPLQQQQQQQQQFQQQPTGYAQSQGSYQPHPQELQKGPFGHPLQQQFRQQHTAQHLPLRSESSRSLAASYEDFKVARRSPRVSSKSLLDTSDEPTMSGARTPPRELEDENEMEALYLRSMLRRSRELSYEEEDIPRPDETQDDTLRLRGGVPSPHSSIPHSPAASTAGANGHVAGSPPDLKAMFAASRGGSFKSGLSASQQQQQGTQGGNPAARHTGNPHQQQQLQPIYSGQPAYQQQGAQDMQNGYPSLDQQQQQQQPIQASQSQNQQHSSVDMKNGRRNELGGSPMRVQPSDNSQDQKQTDDGMHALQNSRPASARPGGGDWGPGDRDPVAEQILSTLRIMACGGDGSVTWVLQSISDLDLKPRPPVGIIPLGTGNGMSCNLGWGKTMRAEWIVSRGSMFQELKAVANAAVRKLDSWDITISTPQQGMHKLDELPAATHPDVEGDQDKKTATNVKGCFYYYFSVGLDAETAYRRPRTDSKSLARLTSLVSHLQDKNPKWTNKRKLNHFWYAWMSARTGWMGSGKLLRQALPSFKWKRDDGQWQETVISEKIRALVILNFQSYSGGKDIWGLHDYRIQEESDKGFGKPIFDDGHIEVIGLKGLWHTFGVLSGMNRHLHGVRLAQASELVFDFKAAGDLPITHFRLDGEPWAQPLAPGRTGPVRVHIQRSDPARILLNVDDIPHTTQRALKLAQRELELSSPEELDSSSSSSEGDAKYRMWLRMHGAFKKAKHPHHHGAKS
ncbi:hypothetical protein WJX74_007566 [Apatococcus lobatus]